MPNPMTPRPEGETMKPIASVGDEIEFPHGHRTRRAVVLDIDLTAANWPVYVVESVSGRRKNERVAETKVLGFYKQRPALPPTPAASGGTDADLLETAWGLIANASQGDWLRETPEWRDAAARWRDARLKFTPPASAPGGGTIEPPAIHESVMCLVCAREKPWGTWSPKGVAVCIDCRNAAREDPEDVENRIREKVVQELMAADFWQAAGWLEDRRVNGEAEVTPPASAPGGEVGEDIKRWQMWCMSSHGHHPMESANGLFVTYEDHAAAVRRAAEQPEARVFPKLTTPDEWRMALMNNAALRAAYEYGRQGAAEQGRREAAKMYGEHRAFCAIGISPDRACDCGLAALADEGRRG